MRDYGQIVTKITTTSWLMAPESLDTLLSIVSARIAGERLTDDQIEEKLAGARQRSLYNTYGATVSGGVGILPIAGPIFGKANLLTALSGATSLEEFRSDFRAMLGDDEVRSIVLEMDTPGGSSDLVPEVGAEILAAREVKPIYAVANTMAGSAGLWLASQATKFFATPSGHVGSLGVYRVHQDQSQKDFNDGNKFTYVKAGRYKTEGNPHEPLSSEAIAFHQSEVDELYSQFLSVVANGRGLEIEDVERDFGQGRTYSAKRAAQVGMIDGIVEMDSLVKQLQSQPQRISVVFNGTQTSATLSGNTINLDYAEHADLEHSEPGTGSPPIPRTDEDDKSGDRKGSGSRRDTPPIVAERENQDNAQTSSMHGEEDNAMKLSNAALTALGLSADADDEAISTAILNLADQAGTNGVAAAKQKSFEELFPEQAAELKANRETRLTGDAKAFVADHKFVTKLVGDALTPTSVGLSALAMESIQAAHVAIASGADNALEQFESCVKLLNSSNARVDYKEEGSSRNTEGDEDHVDATENTNVRSAAKMITDRAKAIQSKATSPISWGDALAQASKEMPEAAKLYHQSLNPDRS